MWPILITTNVDPETVHVVAVYYGHSKPSIHELLYPFVVELGNLLRDGFSPDSKILADSTTLYRPVELSSIIADLPAHSLIKEMKGHAGYSSCPKCTVLGHRCMDRMSFIPAVHNDMLRQVIFQITPKLHRV